MNSSEYKVREYCNKNYDIRELYEAVAGRKPGHGKCYCIFHDNHNTPAAKIYDNSLKCFGECNRMFGPYDILRVYFPEELARIRNTIIVPEVVKKRKPIQQMLKRYQLDLTKPIDQIITEVIQFNMEK